MRQTRTIIFIDDQRSDAKLLERHLDAVPDLECDFVHIMDADNVLDDLADLDPTLIFLDYQLGQRDGIDVLRELRQAGYTQPVIVLTSRGSEYVAFEITRAGADDYILKDDLSPGLLQGVVQRNLALMEREGQDRKDRAAALRGIDSLTRREREVLEFIIEGMTTREIASKLHRSEKTIKIHRGNLMKKMEASTAGDLVRKAMLAKEVIGGKVTEDRNGQL
jgi:DNA-binding NarL/FixJ family response regulator